MEFEVILHFGRYMIRVMMGQPQLEDGDIFDDVT